MRGLWVPVLLCAMVACGRSTPAAGDGKDGTQVNAAERIARALAMRRSGTACGAAASAGVPDEVIAVTTQQCLSCLDVGGLLREAARESRRTGTDLRVLSSEADTADVCGFVRREKVRLPVVFVADTSFPREERPGPLYFIELDSAGAARRIESAATGAQLLEKMRGQQTSPSAARSSSR